MDHHFKAWIQKNLHGGMNGRIPLPDNPDFFRDIADDSHTTTSYSILFMLQDFYRKEKRGKFIPRDEFIRGSTLFKGLTAPPSMRLTHACESAYSSPARSPRYIRPQLMGCECPGVLEQYAQWVNFPVEIPATPSFGRPAPGCTSSSPGGGCFQLLTALLWRLAGTKGPGALPFLGKVLSPFSAFDF